VGSHEVCEAIFDKGVARLHILFRDVRPTVPEGLDESPTRVHVIVAQELDHVMVPELLAIEA
jgi:hypothetical protein